MLGLIINETNRWLLVEGRGFISGPWLTAVHDLFFTLDIRGYGCLTIDGKTCLHMHCDGAGTDGRLVVATEAGALLVAVSKTCPHLHAVNLAQFSDSLSTFISAVATAHLQDTARDFCGTISIYALKYYLWQQSVATEVIQEIRISVQDQIKRASEACLCHPWRFAALEKEEDQNLRQLLPSITSFLLVDAVSEICVDASCVSDRSCKPRRFEHWSIMMAMYHSNHPWKTWLWKRIRIFRSLAQSQPAIPQKICSPILSSGIFSP
jgi:hypothetical protein